MSSSLDRMFEPQSVAVIGASNIPGKWGFVIPMNIKMGQYTGKLYLVNPTEKRVLGLKAHPHVSAVDDPVDLAVVTIPAGGVPQAMRDCAQKGIRNVLVISSNFSETGAEGARLEQEVVGIARDAGINMIGPNTMGMCSPPSHLFAMYAAVYPDPGAIAFVSQSGNLGVQVLGWAYREGVGISRFVNSGNEATLSSDTLLEYFETDEKTRVILLYMEGVKNGQRFLETARRVGRTKPIIVLKAGATEAGARAARSHSGSIAGERKVFEAAAQQAGIILVQSTEELIETARSFFAFPVPNGHNVGVMTMGGGWGVVAADACAREGLFLPPLSRTMTEDFDTFLPAFWSRTNPVDLVGTPQRSSHFRVLEAMARAEEFDGVITMGTLLTLRSSTWRPYQYYFSRLRRIIRGFSFSVLPLLVSVVKGIRRSLNAQKNADKRGDMPVQGRGGQSLKTGGINLRELKEWDDRVFARRVMDLMAETEKPILTVGFIPEAIKFIFKTTGLVVFGSPERAAMALSRLARYGTFRRRAREREKEVLKTPALSEPAMHLLFDRHGSLDEHEAKLLLRECGVPVVREEVAATLDEALSLAGTIGYPVCLKVLSPQILHKTDVGGVALNIRSSDGLRKAHEEIVKNVRTRMPGVEIAGVLVQEMISDGTEVIVGISQDPQFGPVVLFGLGGIFVEALKDISLRVAPVTRLEAWDMVNEIKGARVLKGFRGQPPADVDSIVDALIRLSSFASAHRDRIAEIDINPLIVREKGKGARAVDALVVLR